MKKEKKKMNPIFMVIRAIIIGIIVIVGIFFGSMIIGSIIDIATGKVVMNASDTKRSLSASVSKEVTDVATNVATQDSSTGSKQENEIEMTSDKLNWYDTLHDAMVDTSLIESDYYFPTYISDTSRLVADIKNANGTDYIIYAKPKPNGVVLEYAAVYYKNGQYSQPYRMGTNYIDYTHSYDDKYDCDDNVAAELVMEYAMGPIITAENGNQVFYGSWGDQKEIESMTIDGHKPDKVVSYVMDGKEQFFWYYTQTDLATKLGEIDYSNYTLQQVTDLIGIKYELDTSVENAKDKY